MKRQTESAKYHNIALSRNNATSQGSFNHTAFKLSVALLRIFQISSAAHIAIGVRSIKVGRYAHASPTPHHKWLEGRSAGFITQPSWPTTKRKPVLLSEGYSSDNFWWWSISALQRYAKSPPTPYLQETVDLLHSLKYSFTNIHAGRKRI